MKFINILLLCGGDGSEHDISLVSAQYIEKQLSLIEDFHVTKVIIHKNGWVTHDGKSCFVTGNKQVTVDSKVITVDYVIPCIHGFPGETGDIQSLLEINDIPYLGCPSEGSKLCFNKVSTKLWLNAIGIPNTPFVFLDNKENLDVAHDFFKANKSVFVKAASQGSSVGCYKVTDEDELDESIFKAFSYSQDVLIEKAVCPRELEVAAYEYNGELIITNPGEIITPNNDFYTFEEKYNSESKSITLVEADLSENLRIKIKEFARKAFKVLKLKDLSRIDFFYTNEEGILLNEINTFPGMTPISMFPKMLENHGECMKDFLADRILSAIKKTN